MLLEGKQLAMRYGEETIFEKLDLRLDKGQSLAVTGASGCGKSTLLSILGLLLQPTDGTVLYQGQDTGEMSDAQRSRLRNRSFGFLFQHVQLIGSLSALDNVLVPALLARQRGMEGEAKKLLKELGLTGRLHHYPHQLSIGQKRRVALARALLMKPELVFADEPTNDLDAENIRIVTENLLRLPELGCGLILVTHDEALAARTDRCLRME